MKSIIILILLLPVVYGLYGGEVWSYHFNDCERLEATITASSQIDKDEYEVLNNCTKENNKYYCDCNNNYYFNMSFKTNTVNNYSINFDYWYLGEKVTTTKSSGGRTSSLNIKTLFFVSEGQTLYPINGLRYPLTIKNITNTTLTVRTRGEDFEIQLNDTKEILPIDMSLNYYQYSNGRARIKFIELVKEQIVVDLTDINITEEIIEEINETINITEEPINTTQIEIEKEPSNIIGVVIAIFVVIIGLVIYGIYWYLK